VQQICESEHAGNEVRVRVRVRVSVRVRVRSSRTSLSRASVGASFIATCSGI
jgi:hypothetical protein